MALTFNYKFKFIFIAQTLLSEKIHNFSFPSSGASISTTLVDQDADNVYEDLLELNYNEVNHLTPSNVDVDEKQQSSSNAMNFQVNRHKKKEEEKSSELMSSVNKKKM